MTVDIAELASWLDGLPSAAQRRDQVTSARQAVEGMEKAAAKLGEAAGIIRAQREGYAHLDRPAAEYGSWRALRDALQDLPEANARSLASYAHDAGRLPIHVERLRDEVAQGWRAACQEAAKEVESPLTILRGAVVGGETQDAKKFYSTIGVFLSRLKQLTSQMQQDPAQAEAFAKTRDEARKLLARALEGLPDPDALIGRLRGGIPLASLTVEQLGALQTSLLARAIRVVLQ